MRQKKTTYKKNHRGVLRRVLMGGLLGLAIAVTAWLAGSTPHVLAASGGGWNGQGIPGCPSSYFLTTCYGASWEFYEWPEGHHGSIYIPGTDDLYAGATGSEISPGGYISASCEEAGGYWRYAMVSQRSRSMNGYSWGPNEQVGISSLNGGGSYWYRSVKFGGGMTFRGSNWSEVESAFYEAKDAGFISPGMDWSGSSSLGWFCYGEGIKGYKTEWESDTSATLTVNGSTISSATSARSSQYNRSTSVTLPNYEITADTFSGATITWNHNLYRVDNEEGRGETGYYLYRDGQSITDWKTASLDTAGSIAPVETRTMDVSNSGLSAGEQNHVFCEGIYHDAVTRMIDDGTDYEGTDSYAQSQACVSLSRPYEITVSDTDSDMDTLYIGEQGDYEYSVTFAAGSTFPDEPVDLDGDGELEMPPPPRYAVMGFWADVDGYDSGGNVLSGGYGSREVDSGSCSGIGVIAGATRDCEVIASGEYHGDISGSGSVDVPDEEIYVGAKYCIAVTRNYYSSTGSFSGYAEGANSWGLEEVSCSPTYKKPNFRVTGAQAYTGGGVESLIVRKTTGGYSSAGINFSSWSEFNLAAGGSVSNFGTGAFWSFGSASSATNDFSQMTIANTSGLGNSGIDPGSQTFINKLDNYIAKIKNLGGLTTVSQGGVNFSCSSIHGICFYEGGSATITGNITAGGAYPVYVIRTSGDINVAAGATYVDSWLISDGGKVNTCSSASSVSDLSHDICNQTLTINGPVYGRSLSLMRTAGANGQSASQGDARRGDAESAETINFPAKTYVWAYEESVTSDVRLYESGATELAPRI